ncbi:hypothetical protein GQR58_019790 [Nymphon striatum]|nr:hypothetical protein GQR58_019790 [Nymphon striatum]
MSSPNKQNRKKNENPGQTKNSSDSKDEKRLVQSEESVSISSLKTPVRTESSGITLSNDAKEETKAEASSSTDESENPVTTESSEITPSRDQKEEATAEASRSSEFKNHATTELSEITLSKDPKEEATAEASSTDESNHLTTAESSESTLSKDPKEKATAKVSSTDEYKNPATTVLSEITPSKDQKEEAAAEASSTDESKNPATTVLSEITPSKDQQEEAAAEASSTGESKNLATTVSSEITASNYPKEEATAEASSTGESKHPATTGSSEITLSKDPKEEVTAETSSTDESKNPETTEPSEITPSRDQKDATAEASSTGESKIPAVTEFSEITPSKGLKDLKEEITAEASSTGESKNHATTESSEITPPRDPKEEVTAEASSTGESKNSATAESSEIIPSRDQKEEATAEASTTGESKNPAMAESAEITPPKDPKEPKEKIKAEAYSSTNKSNHLETTESSEITQLKNPKEEAKAEASLEGSSADISKNLVATKSSKITPSNDQEEEAKAEDLSIDKVKTSVKTDKSEDISQLEKSKEEGEIHGKFNFGKEDVEIFLMDSKDNSFQDADKEIEALEDRPDEEKSPRKGKKKGKGKGKKIEETELEENIDERNVPEFIIPPEFANVSTENEKGKRSPRAVKACGKCGMLFFNLGSYQSHWYREQGLFTTNFCQPCGINFVRRCELEFHKKNVHKSVKELHLILLQSKCLYVGPPVLAISGLLHRIWLYRSDHNRPDIRRIWGGNDELSKVSDWLVANKLTLNVDKSNFLIISPSRKHKTNKVNLFINNTSIAQKDCIKYIGVLLDKDLSWKQHIQQVKLKISKGIGILAKIRHYVPQQILRNLYFAFIQPHVNYALINWGSANLSSLIPVGRNLNKAIKIMNFNKNTASSKPIFHKFGILNLDDSYTLQCAKFMYDINTGTQVNFFCKLFQKTTSRHSYNTRQAARKKFAVPRARTNLKKRLITFNGVKIWNDVPLDIRSKL